MDDNNLKTIGKITAFGEKILSYCVGKKEAEFLADDLLAEACVFNLIQIGESMRLLDDAFIAAHNEIPWHKIRGLRNRIVHDYDGVDMLLIWDIISDDLSDLIKSLNRIKPHCK